MSLKKDKQKVLGESFSDERIKTFLDKTAPEGVNEDYHILEHAYRGMIPDNFATFAKFFVEAGKDINAKNPDGKTLLQQVNEHRHGEDYVQALAANGAQ